MKDQPIKQIVCLKAKVYSVLLYSGKQEGKLKGVPSSAVKQQCLHDNYLEHLDSDVRQCVHYQKIVATSDLRMYTTKQIKTALSSFDSKRRFIDDSYCTHAHGHFRNRLATGT